MMSCSRIGSVTSSRDGSWLIAPRKFSLSSVIHCGTPRRSTAASASLMRDDLLRRLADLNDVARTHEVRRDVDLLAVDREVTVADELARLGVIAREAHAVDDVVEPALEQLDQRVTRDARRLERLVVVAAELALGDAVDALDLLLLAQLLAVVRALAAAVLAVLARRIRAALVAALVRVATLSLEEELHVFTPAKPTNCTRVASHGF